jgi:hypothetical protein
MTAWTAPDAAELRDLEAAFAEAGGRGVDLAERIDELRAQRDAAGWRTWNVIAPVIAVLSAPSSDEALSRLTRALKAAGFDVYDDPAAADSFPPFEAEDGTEESDPPPNGWPW